MTIEIETVAQLLAAGYRVETFCPKCGRRGPDLDLPKYIADGRGDMRPIDLRVRHQRCRTVLDLSIQPAKGYGK